MEKICLAELKKKIKAEKEILNQLIRNDEANRKTQIFIDKDVDLQTQDNDYNYFDTNYQIQESMLYITRMTALLNKITSTTIITCGDFVGSISEAIILLKYLTQMKNRADAMSYRDVGQKLTYDNKMVKTKYFYEKEYIQEKIQNLTKSVADLQMAIDKAMFSTTVDVSNIQKTEFKNEIVNKIFGI